MQRLVLFALLFLCLCLPFFESSAQEAGLADSSFFLSIEDMPLMAGLEELPQDTVSFDKPEGRIIESYAVLDKGITKEQVSTYYRGALPQFGWGYVQGNQYFRGAEYLDLSFIKKGERDFLRITVRPSL